MRDNVDATNIYAPLSPEDIETGLVTTSIFEIQKILMNTVECDDVPDYLKSYQKAQAAALLSHSASGACPSCKSYTLVHACAPVSDVKPPPRKMTSIFKLLASQLTRLGRKTLSKFGDMRTNRQVTAPQSPDAGPHPANRTRKGSANRKEDGDKALNNYY
ncbi:hypothetical protein [Agrobacterium fabrum]|uniref:hypothetical protein n=1 Tax=Agrobacterium fabrum TaxID=1176649 RepID=UPI002474427A|nr:hypothetical protein [Agrobacterium fabrum]MDH6298790.1 hypothetical protein [Agrobacterium fabrum]